MNSILIVGCGRVGIDVARRELESGHRVTGVVRSAASLEVLAVQGIPAVGANLDDPATLVSIPVGKAGIYYFAPPPPTGQRDVRMENFLAATRNHDRPARVVLISTSGVYGDCGGDWVSEDRPPRPDSDRGRRRLDAERQLLEYGESAGVPVVILRVPGIYGPGRLPLQRLQAREPVLREAESPWSNRVHMDDLVAACGAAMRRGPAGAVYNISDGHPTTMTDYFNRVADAAGLPRPDQIPMSDAPARLSAGMLSYLSESKRLDNRKMREELGVEPRYTDLAAGLRASIDNAEPTPCRNF